MSSRSLLKKALYWPLDFALIDCKDWVIEKECRPVKQIIPFIKRQKRHRISFIDFLFR